MQEEIKELRAEVERLTKENAQLFLLHGDQMVMIHYRDAEVEHLTKENNWLQEHAGVIK